MKRIALLLSPIIFLSACSGEDVQISIEKAQPTVEEDRDITPPVSASIEIQTEQASAPLMDQQPNIEKPTPFNTDTNSQIGAIEMQEHEASLASVDDALALKHYGEMGSATSLQLGSVPLKISAVTVERGKQGLVSSVKSVSGATSITSDPTGFGFSIELSGDYLFEFDKDTLTPKAQEALKSVYTLYQDYEGTFIEVIGHTDSKGANDYNLALSKRRATAVKSWFQNKEIAGSLITTQGLGETKPTAANTKDGKDYPEGRALNRRVEISVRTKKKISHLPTISNKADIEL